MFTAQNQFLRSIAALLALSVAAAAADAQSTSTPQYDMLIRGGRIVDGTGNPSFAGDVAIIGERIVRVGSIGDASAARVVDAAGLVVAPGFIDLHGHSTNALLTDGNGESKLRQGVTLEVIGEGESPAPANDPAEGRSWDSFTDYFADLMREGISMNLIAHVSYNQIRRNVMGYKEGPASSSELEQMRDVTARSMREGAWGMTSEFPSGGPEHIEEVIELAKVVAAHGGNFTSHTGSEGFEQAQELDAVFRIAEEAQIPVHTFHLKVRSRENWGTMRRFLDQIEAARARGLDVTSNQYPYTAMNHGWAEFFPLWAREGGPEAFARRLNDPATRERIKTDPDFRIWSEEHGGWDGIVLGYAAHTGRPDYEGMTIAEIAASRGDTDPADTAIALMAEENGRIRGLFHTMSEEDVRLIMRQPWVAIASDGQAINMENYPGLPHPRYYGTNARVLGHYAREERVLKLEDAVRKMTSLPAQILRLGDRGQVHEGFVADITIFDPQTVRATNSFERPRSYAAGVHYTIVNGAIVIDGGEHTGTRPGRALLGHGAAREL
ncbi:MAG: D-aminoacylase [Gammaproteobacteria bacterium]|nr:D-aminoacylase [Gammaproteobacteria bacterium]